MPTDIAGRFQHLARILMATVSSLAGAHPPKDAHRGLSYSMHRVLKELENLRESSRGSAENEDAVHDLRVSLRRCRSIASVMEAVDPEPAWREMRQAGKKLFQGLGALRDAHVLSDWVKKLTPVDDPLAAAMLKDLSDQESPLQDNALRAGRKFDQKNWRRLEQTLRHRGRLVPAASAIAENLALQSFENVKAHHTRALRTESATPWHELRKAVKEFRYVIENFLPEHHSRWREDLKRIQDLLGDIHDLDVLSGCVEATTISDSEGSRSVWHERLSRERASRVMEYRGWMTGAASLWSAWRHALPHGERLRAVAVARLKVVARAADPHPRRTTREARLAKGLYSALRRAKGGKVFADARFKDLLGNALCLQNVRDSGGRKSSQTKHPQKAAYKFLRQMTIPPGITEKDWLMVLAVVRYRRGVEPREDARAFINLSVEQRAAVSALAGTMRLARALRKSGVASPVGFRAENKPEAIILRIPGLVDTVEAAARIAAAKHLLETYLGKPLVLRAVPQLAPAEAAIPLPAVNQPAVLLHFATASD
jgi:CHAD domain-containing protein